MAEHRRDVEPGAADADDGLAGHGVGDARAVVGGGEPLAGDVALEHGCGSHLELLLSSFTAIKRGALPR
jgi:hypothetical protein